jgi:DNA-binding transcriptional LysR family regulator
VPELRTEARLDWRSLHAQQIDAVLLLEVIKQLVAQGVGIAVVSRDAVADQVSLGRLVTLRVEGLTIVRPFNRLTLLRKRPSAAARAFLEMLAEEAKRRSSA